MTYSRVKQIARDEGGVTNRADVAKKVERETGVPAVELLGLVPWNPESRGGWDPDGDGGQRKGEPSAEEPSDAKVIALDERRVAREPEYVPVPDGSTASLRVGRAVRPPSRSARSSNRRRQLAAAHLRLVGDHASNG